jgi:hypothetical protein
MDNYLALLKSRSVHRVGNRRTGKRHEPCNPRSGHIPSPQPVRYRCIWLRYAGQLPPLNDWLSIGGTIPGYAGGLPNQNR